MNGVSPSVTILVTGFAVCPIALYGLDASSKASKTNTHGDSHLSNALFGLDLGARNSPSGAMAPMSDGMNVRRIFISLASLPSRIVSHNSSQFTRGVWFADLSVAMANNNLVAAFQRCRQREPFVDDRFAPTEQTPSQSGISHSCEHPQLSISSPRLLRRSPFASPEIAPTLLPSGRHDPASGHGAREVELLH